jgi:hypothetical protein
MTEFVQIGLVSMLMSFAMGTIVGLIWRIILVSTKK